MPRTTKPKATPTPKPTPSPPAYMPIQLAIVEILDTRGAQPLSGILATLDYAGLPGSGELRWETGWPNVVFWDGIDQAAVDALRSLEKAGITESRPLSPAEVVFIHGHEGAPIPRLPAATMLGIKRGYKRVHWLALEIRLKPGVERPAWSEVGGADGRPS